MCDASFLSENKAQNPAQTRLQAQFALIRRAAKQKAARFGAAFQKFQDQDRLFVGSFSSALGAGAVVSAFASTSRSTSSMIAIGALSP